VHWDHKGDASNVIGSINPATIAERDEGLYVEGRLDLDDSATAREAWRSVKNGSMSLSFGYITTKSRKRSDGINELLELDLFEISIVPHPANPDTRILSTKGLDDDDFSHVRDEWHNTMTTILGVDRADLLRAKAARLERELAPIRVEVIRVLTAQAATRRGR
jgi:HK97 family phage prohead protease